MSIFIINSPYASALITEVRDVESPKEILRQRLYDLGRVTAETLIGDGLISEKQISTPMGVSYKGFSLPRSTTVIISTRDDYAFFANGVSSCFSNHYRGYMDFGGARGPEALKSKRRAIEFPSIKTGDFVENLIIAKSVLATGCTAISLTQSAIAKYHPRRIIVVAVFYSQQGIQELITEIPNINKIYAYGDPDILNEDGMLMPGVGNLDARLS